MGFVGSHMFYRMRGGGKDGVVLGHCTLCAGGRGFTSDGGSLGPDHRNSFAILDALSTKPTILLGRRRI